MVGGKMSMLSEVLLNIFWIGIPILTIPLVTVCWFIEYRKKKPETK
jgi:urea transporter